MSPEDEAKRKAEEKKGEGESKGGEFLAVDEMLESLNDLERVSCCVVVGVVVLFFVLLIDFFSLLHQKIAFSTK